MEPWMSTGLIFIAGMCVGAGICLYAIFTGRILRANDPEICNQIDCTGRRYWGGNEPIEISRK